MGRTAKVMKRAHKKSTTSSTSQAPAKAAHPAQQSAPLAKKKAAIKAQTKRRSSGTGDGGHVLGGADYVDLMMGSRRKARQEALKLPRDP